VTERTTRKGVVVKRFSVILVAALALFASQAAIAAASSSFNVEQAPARVGGSQATANVFTTSYTEFKCNKANFAGELLSLSTSSLVMTPTYETCTFGGNAGTTVNMNGCQYKFEAGPVHTMQIICPAGHEMVIVTKVTGVVRCTTTIPPQAVTGFATENSGAGSGRGLTLSFQLNGIRYSQVPGAAGLLRCDERIDATDGTYTGSVYLGAKTSGGAADGFWAS
jgi:hypothetical protein